MSPATAETSFNQEIPSKSDDGASKATRLETMAQRRVCREDGCPAEKRLSVGGRQRWMMTPGNRQQRFDPVAPIQQGMPCAGGGCVRRLCHKGEKRGPRFRTHAGIEIADIPRFSEFMLVQPIRAVASSSIHLTKATSQLHRLFCPRLKAISN